MITLPLVHPRTHTPLVRESNVYRSPDTGETFPIESGVPIFVDPKLRAHMADERTGIENGIKTLLRRSPLLYRFLIFLISPVCFTGVSAKRFLHTLSPSTTVLNIGAGIHGFGPRVLNIDIFPYKGVDIAANAEELPFADASVDGVVCESLLEHVPDPKKIVSEMLRVLKPGGKMYIVIPFVYPFHASPNDFYRWSTSGVRALCSPAIVIDMAARAGPTSALFGQFTTWLAIVLSFGISPLYHFFSMLLPVLFFPIKFLDWIVGRYPTAIHGSAQFYAIVEKR